MPLKTQALKSGQLLILFIGMVEMGKRLFWVIQLKLTYQREATTSCERCWYCNGQYWVQRGKGIPLWPTDKARGISLIMSTQNEYSFQPSRLRNVNLINGAISFCSFGICLYKNPEYCRQKEFVFALTGWLYTERP